MIFKTNISNAIMVIIEIHDQKIEFRENLILIVIIK